MNTYTNEEKPGTLTAAAYLEQIVSSDIKIFIDTCSLLDKGFPLFMEHVLPLLEAHSQRIIVPYSVIDELKKKLVDPEKPKLHMPAFQALEIISKNRSSFIIRGEKGDTFPDNLFQTIQLRYRLQYRMLFITQDNGLTVDLLNNNDSSSVRAYASLVKRITPQGYLNNNTAVIRENGKWIVPDRKTVSLARVLTQKSESVFRTFEHPTGMADEVIPLTEVPAESDTIYAMKPESEQFAEVELGKLIASGGEGSVYETNTPFVAKIYKEDKVTTLRKEKVMMMAKKELECKGISFPVCPLFNSHNEFIGYLMKKAVGEELRTSIFCPIPRFREKHPDWKRENLVQLCIAILKKIDYLHSRNIIIGDINPGNILVKSPTEVFFVDTDSYQIEDLPCPVGQCNYTAPEIQGKEYSSFLRTMGNENFAIATLLFQILLPGKLPYSHAGGGRQNENILEMNFPYRLGENGNKNEPGGQWKFMWSHMTYAIKEAFYNTFQKGGTYTDENKRLSAADWKQLLLVYYDFLHSGKYAQNDPMSDDIFPTRWKAGPGALWTVCRHCGEKFPYYESKSRGNAAPPTHCFNCQQKICEWILCGDCGTEFPVYAPQYDYIKEKEYELPKRCPDCRNKRKAEAERQKEEVRKIRYGGLNFNCKPAGQPQPVSGTMPRSVPVPAPAPRPQPIPGPTSKPEPAPFPKTMSADDPQPTPSPDSREKFLTKLRQWLAGA